MNDGLKAILKLCTRKNILPKLYPGCISGKIYFLVCCLYLSLNYHWLNQQYVLNDKITRLHLWVLFEFQSATLAAFEGCEGKLSFSATELLIIHFGQFCKQSLEHYLVLASPI